MATRAKKNKDVNLASQIEMAGKTLKEAFVLFFKIGIVLSLVVSSFLIFVRLGPIVAKNYYYSFDDALLLNAICNTVLTIWGLIVAVYLHSQILEEEYDDWLNGKLGKFWSNLTRPKVSVFLFISSMLLLLTFIVIKRTELRIEELTQIVGQ